ncbi:DUF1212-domain-containing protein [Lichtheimia hyalospora FSU 10163]|nr:DUF1212-domain-containing protein [Lichtheimia hyalospora FSU 10163]
MKTSISYPESICLASETKAIRIHWSTIRNALNDARRGSCHGVPTINEKRKDEEWGPDDDHDDGIVLLKRRVLVNLSRSLLLYGAPCHRIEESLEQAAHVLGLEAAFFFIPGIMMICFGDMEPRTLLVRCPQGFDMGKLAKVTGVANAICQRKLTLQECIDKLENIAQASPTWGPWAILMAHTVSSLLTTPVMFNGSWMDTAVSGGLGLMVGMLTLVAGKYASYCNIFEISTAILVAFVAKALNPWICFTGVSLSATATLLPGYILTMSIMELSAKHVITGTIRFIYALIYALFIGYGLEIGTSIYDALDPSSSPTNFDTCAGSMPPWIYVGMFPFVAISMATTLGATLQQWPSMVFCSAVGFGTTLIASRVITNYQIVGTISAFSVGLFGNLYLKVTGDLALVPLSCGIVLLVPGSVGIQGAYFLIRQDDQGTSFAIQMVVASLGIAVGLFTATLLVYPKGKRRYLYLSY